MAQLGSSLLVPSVQELAKQSLTTVPSRYLRPDQDSQFISNESVFPQVPTIDMHKLLSKEDTDKELERLHHACKDWGFFQLINHGVSIEKVKVEIQNLFNLPMEEKKKYWQTPEDLEGFGQVFVTSEEQKLNWSDMLYMITQPKSLRKPRLLPKFPVEIRDTLEAYSEDVLKLNKELFKFLAKSLKMDPKYMNELFEEGWQSMRMNYYPPCPQPELSIGFDSHSDAIGLTILLQINETYGLQIKKDAMWIPIKPLKNAFVVNVGDIFEIVSNGVYTSIEHRAVVNSSTERISLATFYGPDFNANVGPAPSLITPETPALFRRIRVEDYYKGYFSQELRGKSYVDAMRIKNEGENAF